MGEPRRGPRRPDHFGEGHVRGAGSQRRQARKRARQDCRRQARGFLRRQRPVRPGVRPQRGLRGHSGRDGPADGCLDGREHQRPSVLSCRSRRRRGDRGHGGRRVVGRRVVLKLSGEAFADPELGYGIDPDTVSRVAAEIAEVNAEGHEIAIVVGGGNIFRGISTAAAGMDRANADYMGMLATVINA
ncbi:MAG: hypothetical protein HKN93_11420, partial [Acidimicrobiia bacterium]|nr:hypothetical protein [Acidimicrobiia bacterium]